MAHPAATVFALTMAVWVADVRMAPKHADPAPAPVAAAACQNGINPSTPADADLEIVTCGARLQR